MRVFVVLILMTLAGAACKDAGPPTPVSSASSPAGAASTVSPIEDTWTDRDVHFSARYIFYPSFQAAVEAPSDGAVDAVVADGSSDFEAARVEVTANPKRGAGFPWTFDTTFRGAAGGSARRWSCSKDTKSGVCRALLTFPRGLRSVTTRVVQP